MHVCVFSNLANADGLLSLPLIHSSPLSPYPEPRPLMKLGVSGSVRLIGQVCPGLRLPVIEVSSEDPLCSRRCTLLSSTPTAKTLTAPLSASL
ncbi:plexin-B2b isoform X1 [Lates japonicus]|uniref:Plexin-B2b isoform X1 n=1 Tax=Lates japonicus TaxID=270547 RepID=A0AAD3MSX7_LATJO|nr:plexin-B2b isoform X1 [Lates japonicus]